MESLKSSLLTNSGKQAHSESLKSCISKAKKVQIAVAFLKMSGLNLFFSSIEKALKRGATVQIAAGLDFTQTDPQALKKLKRLSVTYPAFELFISNPNRATVFHPKVYFFKLDEGTAAAIVGSANFTNGGFVQNEEASIFLEGEISAFSDSFFNYFETLISSEAIVPATERAISIYQNQFARQKPFLEKIVQRPSLPPEQRDEIDFRKLRQHFKKMDTSIFAERAVNYAKAKEVLNEIIDSSQLTHARFSDLYQLLVGKAKSVKLWASGGIDRHKTKVLGNPQGFKEMAEFIRTNIQQTPGKLFIDVWKDHKIDGIGVNIISEIMMTYDPMRCATLNKNPVTVLRSIGCDLNARPVSYNSEEYDDYCHLLDEIRGELGLKNLIEVDAFFNEIYWEMKRKMGTT